MAAANAQFCSESSTATPSRFHGAHGLGHRLDDHGRDPLRGLVEQDRVRVAHEGAGDGEHLLLAAGHLRRRAGRASRQGWERAAKSRSGVQGDRSPPRPAPPDLQVLLHGQVREDAPVLGHVAEARAGDAVGRARPRSSWPLKVRRSARASTRPMMAFRVVVLPAPLRPIRATTSPGPKLERTAEQHLRAAVERAADPRRRAGSSCGLPRLEAPGPSRRRDRPPAPADRPGSRPACPRR